MDVITIFQTLFHWGIIALAGTMILLLTLGGVYLIYRKLFHGRKRITIEKVICAGLLICWLFLVFCLTSMSRGANFTDSINVEFLSGYISAWNNWSISELQLILFNIIMFTPLGFLLPLLWKKAEKMWVTVVVSLCLTGGIEVFQLLTGTGIFELDDLVHNLLGSMFGYFCIMAGLDVAREKKLRLAPFGKVFLIPSLIALILGVVFWTYYNQPYGNMDILPAADQDLSAIKIVQEWESSCQKVSAAVYQNKFSGDKSRFEKIRGAIAELEPLTFSRAIRRENENIGCLGENAEGAECRMIFFSRTGEWSYTTFVETAARLTEETIDSLRVRYEEWMNEQELLPENVEFSVQNGDTLRWDVLPISSLFEGEKAFQQGSVMIRLNKSGLLADFFYQVTWNEYVCTEPIISEKEAYEQVRRGKFEQYVPFQPGDTLHITECKLEYRYDTKGFYQPVYEFSGYINSSENLWVCQIPALQQ